MWKAVVGFEGLYEVSETGVVRSLDRKCNVSDSVGREYTKTMRGKTIAPRKHSFGYWVVTLSKENTPYTRTVHGLVAETFLGERQDRIVRHLDGNPTNNSVANLKYGTQKDNMEDAIRHGTVQKGESRYNAKLTEKIVVAIREEKQAGATISDLAKKYSLSESGVHKIVVGKAWKSAGGPLAVGRVSNILNGESRRSVIEMRNSGLSYAKIADFFNVSVQQVVNIVNKELN